MKFAFIENRYKTVFWIALAHELRSLGHSVVWLVQNPVFMPPGDAILTIPFPRRTDLSDAGQANGLDRVRRADRYINYFGGDDRHYRYYKTAIDRWLDHERPEVVIGESTLFHELIVIDACRRRNIPYFHPCMLGYPSGRYSVYTYDSKVPLEHNNELPSEADCLALAEAIRKRERVPDYMIPPSGLEPERTLPLPRSTKDRLTILRGYLSGERFNTPAPWRKWSLDRQIQQRLKTWQRIATAKAKESKGQRLALYPLQLQPEANIDLWGQEFRDQPKLIAQLADALPIGWHLWVKVNPKAKYELSDELLEVLHTHPKVSPIPLHETMAVVFDKVDLICTVTGTVAVECVLSGKPLVQIGPSIVEEGPGCARIGKPTEITEVVRRIEMNQFTLANDEERVRLIQRLYATSFPGIISDPLNMPAVMATDNVRSVANTLLEVAQTCV